MRCARVTEGRLLEAQPLNSEGYSHCWMQALTLSWGTDAPPPGRGYNREDSEAPEGVFFGSIPQLSF